MSSLIRRSFKIACRLFGGAVLAYAMLFSLTVGGMYSPHGRFLKGAGDVVEAVIFFPQRFLPPPSQISNQVHWLVCVIWMFALLYLMSFVCAILTLKNYSGEKKA
jgi:hypothetical protein